MIVQEHPECLPRMVQRNPLERERMPDTLSPAERSARMALIRSADTELEMLVRRMGRQLGYLYRLHDSSLPGRPDLVFKGPPEGDICARMPKSNLEYWSEKIRSNQRVDIYSTPLSVDW
jgi:DNA mismatch endonuclease (patch repair protein)